MAAYAELSVVAAPMMKMLEKLKLMQMGQGSLPLTLSLQWQLYSQHRPSLAARRPAGQDIVLLQDRPSST